MHTTDFSWQIWVDTGGTFTDCIGRSPEGNGQYAKVLSSGAIRGRILEQINSHTVRMTPVRPLPPGFFTGYSFRLLQSASDVYQITQSDAEANTLSLDRPLAGNIAFPADFELSAGEEAPILAARLITATPLRTPLPAMEMRLGSTKGTNALLERKGADVGLLITRGFTDLLEIGTQQRPELFALHIRKPAGLYARVIEVPERIAASGEVLEPLPEGEINRIVDQVRQSGLESWAIALMHSYLNPVHERVLAAALRAAGIPVLSLSSELMPSIKLLPRAQTAVVNAYLAPVIRRYLAAVQEKLPEMSTLRVMTSAGGLVSAPFFTPKDSLLSGPAGGIVGAATIAARSGIPKIVTLDMGGTSTDVARYDGTYDYQYELRVGDAHVQSPALAIQTVAAGGGSICGFDGIRFTVGPQSAGAYPGPACYGAGGPLTITDVNVLLGRADPDTFGIPLNVEAARQALAKVREDVIRSTGTAPEPEELLLGFLQIANERMADAIRQISIRKGYDPTGYALLAFGGAGGQHAGQVAALLRIRRIIISRDAGLLSAYGMGQADIERFATRQILRPLAEIPAELPALFHGLSREALAVLAAEGFPEKKLHIRRMSLFVRFTGQEATIEVPYEPGGNIPDLFREKYTALYGYWIGSRPLEVESLKVIASTRVSAPEEIPPAPQPYAPAAYKTQSWLTGTGRAEIPVYRWAELSPGARLAGPALVVSPTSTTLVDADWTFAVDAAGTGIMERSPETAGTPDEIQTSAAIERTLFSNRFSAIAEEMGSLLERTAFSVNVKERLDFSCALLDADGYLVINAPHIPVHLGSLGICVRRVMEAIRMEAGDVIITNHPAFGGSHLPDITLISPVHADSGERIGFVANRAHHAEVGGKRPGSMPPDARNLAEEGVVIPPMYLIRRGEAQWKAITAVLENSPYPTRALPENLADLRAALAAIQAGKTALISLCRTYGTARVSDNMRQLKTHAARSLQRSLERIPPGTYAATEWLDDGSRISVQIGVDASAIHVDFTGTSGVHPANLNATPAIVNSAVMYVLRLMVPDEVPLNEGLMDIVRLHIPPGMLNPDFPSNARQCPAVVGGNTETSQRVVDTLLKALEMAAGSQGTMNNLVFGNQRFGYYETIGGGAGAGEGFAGASAVHQHMTNTRITDPEILEFRYPVRLERFAIRPDSGGKGQWPGGNGIIRDIRFLEPVSLTVLAEHRKVAPYGLRGGEPGAPGRQYIIRADGTTETLDGSRGAEMQPGDRIRIETPGGGGWGESPA